MMLKDDLPPSGVAHTPARRLEPWPTTLRATGRARSTSTSAAPPAKHAAVRPVHALDRLDARLRGVRQGRRARRSPAPSRRSRASRSRRCRAVHASAPRPSTARAAARSTGSRRPSRSAVPVDYVHTTSRRTSRSPATASWCSATQVSALTSRCRTRAARCSAACASRSRAGRGRARHLRRGRHGHERLDSGSSR